MEKIPTAKEILAEEMQKLVAKDANSIRAMKKFAKMHVTAALKQAAHESQCYNKAKFPGDENWVVDIESILNSYPLENIK